MKGQEILSDITAASLFSVHCANKCDCGCVISWSSGSDEQIEAIFAKHSDPQMQDMAFLIVRLARIIRKSDPDNDTTKKALDYLHKIGHGPNPMRQQAGQG